MPTWWRQILAAPSGVWAVCAHLRHAVFLGPRQESERAKINFRVLNANFHIQKVKFKIQNPHSKLLIKNSKSKLIIQNSMFQIQSVQFKFQNVKFARTHARTYFEFRFVISAVFPQHFLLSTCARHEKVQRWSSRIFFSVYNCIFANLCTPLFIFVYFEVYLSFSSWGGLSLFVSLALLIVSKRFSGTQIFSCEWICYDVVAVEDTKSEKQEM